MVNNNNNNTAYKRKSISLLMNTKKKKTKKLFLKKMFALICYTYELSKGMIYRLHASDFLILF